jgi:predicted DCC family thiol-disulfide oxidoreductase YuxK
MGLMRTFVVGNLVALGTYQLVDMLRPEDQSVENWLMFDGVCNLCDGFTHFVADHDALRRVKFGAQQKHMDVLERIGAPTDLSTLVLVQGNAYYTQSAAALRTMALLDWPWAALSVGIIVPSPIRDMVYRLVARHRYQVFGKADECRLPSGDFRTRFIDYNPADEAQPDPISGKAK